MSNQKRRPFWAVMQAAFLDAHHVVISAGVASVAWLIAYTYGRDPDFVEAAWVFFCMMGILFHRENLSETYHDQRAVRNHPSSNEADLRNIGDHIRGEWLRILTKSFFLVSGFVSLYFQPRINETLDAIRIVSVMCLVIGVCLLDIDAVLDKVARRHLVSLIIQEINARPLGLSAEERLERAIEVGRDMYHDINNELAVIVPVLECLQMTGRIPVGLDVGEIIRSIDKFQSDLREARALLRSFDPLAGGPTRGAADSNTSEG